MGSPSHLGHMDRVAATMPSIAHAGAAQEAPDIGQWEGQDVPLVRPSSCNVKGGIPSSRRYLPTYLPGPLLLMLPGNPTAGLRRELDICDGLRVGLEAVADSLLALLQRGTADDRQWDALLPHSPDTTPI